MALRYVRSGPVVGQGITRVSTVSTVGRAKGVQRLTNFWGIATTYMYLWNRKNWVREMEDSGDQKWIARESVSSSFQCQTRKKDIEMQNGLRFVHLECDGGR